MSIRSGFTLTATVITIKWLFVFPEICNYQNSLSLPLLHSHCPDANALSCVIYALRWNNCQANNFDWLQPSKMNYPKYFKPQLFILLQNAFHSNSTERIVYSCIDASTCTNCTLSLALKKSPQLFLPISFVKYAD